MAIPPVVRRNTVLISVNQALFSGVNQSMVMIAGLSILLIMGSTALAGFGAVIQVLGSVVNVSYVYWQWQEMDLIPANAFLFQPDISAIPMHFKDLLAGLNVDLWLGWVYHQFGPGLLLLTLLVPIVLFACSAILLFDLNVVRLFNQIGVQRQPSVQIAK